MKAKLLSRCSWIIAFMLAGSMITEAQTSYTFTPAGATDNLGPTQSMVNTAYSSTNLAGNVRVVGGIQYWEVPVSGLYQIEAFGGQGYGSFGGRGAHISGEFLLTGGDTLKILVGQKAGNYLNFPSTTYNHQFGGGGGSFVTDLNNSPYVVAGGGGGNHGTSFLPSCDGQTTTSGASGSNGSITGAGGTGGNGGIQASSADAGAGITGNGDGTAGGIAFVNGGQGGKDEGTGGFGGGGGTSSFNNYRSGGGGGYSGGGGANNVGSCCPTGGGGGSFNGGTNQNNLAGVNLGDGSVIVTLLVVPLDDGGISAFKGIDPVVCNGTVPVEAVVKNYGGNQLKSIDVDWEVNGVAQSTVSVSSTIDTVGGTGADTLVVSLGNINVSGATTVKAWTTNPNNNSDPSNTNDTLEYTIPEPMYISSIDVVDTVSCNGASDGIASVTATSGATPYTYDWSNGGNASTIGFVTSDTYTVVVTDDGGCKDTATIFIPEPTAMVPNEIITPVTSSVDNGAINLSVSGGVPPYTFNWDSGPTTEDISGLAVGTYTVEVTDNTACMDTFSFEVKSVVGIDEKAVVTGFEIYPNPSKTGIFKIKTEGFADNKRVVVRDMVGKVIREERVSTNKAVLDLSGMSEGIYFVKLSDDKSELIKRIVIE